jgi:hypothetical protein
MVRGVLQHSTPLPPEADCPIRHFEASANIGLSLIKYIDDHIGLDSVYEAVYDRHLGHLRRMVLAELIESFERFLKELASVCVDYLAPYAADDRFDEFVPKRGDQIAVFVNARSIGKALCESDTWIKNKTINDRFRSLLRTPFGADWKYLFPDVSQAPAAERDRAATLAILWQLRHNLAHNVGVITQSDSMKFRVLVGGPVQADRKLAPLTEDLRYVKRFLSETATHTNQRIGTRLAALLGQYHAADTGLFDAQATANEVSQRFAFSVTVDGCVGVV